METIVKIFRLEQTDEGALGSMTLHDHLFCTSLEPDDKDPVRNQISAGRYFCQKYSSQKYPHTFEIIVPGHTNVLFHPGNWEEDTTMCVLLGQYPSKLKNQRSVSNSGNTFKKFMAILQDIPWFYTEFINCYGSITSHK